MARVAVALKVFPSGTEVPIEDLVARIKSRLPNGYELVGSREVPIAFGYRAVRLVVTMPEETEGGTEELENIILGTEGVDQVEVEVVHRL